MCSRERLFWKGAEYPIFFLDTGTPDECMYMCMCAGKPANHLLIHLPVRSNSSETRPRREYSIALM